MRTNLLNLIFIVFCFCLIISCSSNKYNGVFNGTLTADMERLGADKSVLDKTTDEEAGLLVTIKQEGKDVFLSIHNSRLLGTCNLRARINKNGTAYIDDPQPCSSSLPITGSIGVGDYEMSFTLSGYSQYSNHVFRYSAKKK